METLFIYLIKASGLIGLFYLAYLLLLRKETFFNSNRWFLLAGLITSVVLPLVVFTKIIWVEPTPTTFDWSNIPITTTTVENEGFEINWYLIFVLVYSIGILGFLILFAFDFYSLYKVLKGKTMQQEGNFKFIDIAENIAPFSYFNYIVYNSALYSTNELKNILEHEKIHSQQKHSLDVLLSRLFCVFFWFNPLIWLYKKAIAQNLEFIADSEASKNISDKKTYQLTLLKITTQENCVTITNHFYQSLIKKRIIMLNQNPSKKQNSWKYITVFPALIAFVFLFQIKVIAQERETQKSENETKSETVDLKSFQLEKNLKTLSEGKEIIINGEKSSQEELDKLDPKGIKKIDVAKISGKKTILVTTKQILESDKFIGKDIYIDGVNSNYEEFSRLDKNRIDKIDISSKKNIVRIITKTSSEEEPLIVVNGILMEPSFDVSKIDPSTITNKRVSKGIEARISYGIEHPYVIAFSTSDENYSPKANLEKAYVIIDGKEADYATFLNLKGKVKEIKVTDCRIYEGTPKANKISILRDYGIKGKNGVLVVKTVPLDKEVNGWKISSEPVKDGPIQDLANKNKINYSNAVIIIDGKVSNYSKDFHLLNPDKIASIKVQKISNVSQKEKDAAIHKYGDKALNGIIEIDTKK